MDDLAKKHIDTYSYHEVKFTDDDSGQYYCKTYDKSVMEGYTKLNRVVFVPNKADAYKEHQKLGSLEVPNVRIKSIKVERVMLSFLEPQ